MPPDESESSLTGNPYDELPYRSLPIEWTAPERLAIASLLHGGPRPPLDTYRVLELGCGNGANLLPLAYYRRHATFVGIDGSRSSIAVADARRAELNLPNLQFIHSDFLSAADRLSGSFDFILAHGVFSWVPDDVRDELFALCVRHLRPGGLLYLNYNTKPGWNVRGMVRDFLLSETTGATDLRGRARLAQDIAARLAASLAAAEHPYSRLMEREFRFVCDNHYSYVAHEYLTTDNHAYWRSEFLALARLHGLEYVADADFSYSSGRIPESLTEQLAAARLLGQPIEDTADLLSYRQLHSPVLASSGWTRCPPAAQEFANLFVASCLEPLTREGAGPRMFRHPSGFEVEAREEPMWTSLARLQSLWPRGERVGALFPDVSLVIEDLRLLHAHGLIELRGIEPGDFAPSPELLNESERRWGNYATTSYHQLAR